VKKCIGYEINADVVDCTFGSTANLTKPLSNIKFLMGDKAQYTSYLNIENCDFNLIDGVNERNIIFNKRDGEYKALNCKFKGGRYFLSSLNNGEFINCEFDKVAVLPNTQFLDNSQIILFKNCIMPIEGYLLKFAPNAYSRGISNVVFENCIITDLGNHKLDGYGAGSALINAFSKPVEGSSVTFKNCTIDKSVGLLLEGYGDTSNGFKLDLIFENTPLSENLQIQDKYNFKNFVNLIIK
jgi:hypothetical protein